VTTQAQLTFDGLPDPPRVGEFLRCRENGRWAQVYGIAEAGKPFPLWGMVGYAGDVVLELGPGYYRVSSPGKFFWDRWERADLDDLARLALCEALGCGA
jgi:hypothetical protein